MQSLQFRIILFPKPKTEPNVLEFERILTRCGFTVQDMHEVEIRNEKQPYRTEHLKYALHVSAVNNENLNNSVEYQYSILSEKWCQLTRNIPNGERPMLQLYEDNYFSTKIISIQKGLEIDSIEFGVYPRSGEFLSYSELFNVHYFTANFFHDIKELEIRDCNEVVIIRYKHIRSIIVDVNSNNEGQLKCFVDLSYPPLFCIKEGIQDRNSGEINERLCRTLPFGVSKDVIKQSNVLLLRFSTCDGHVELLTNLRKNCWNKPIHYVAMDSVTKQAPQFPKINFPHFGCTYMLTALINRNSTILEQAISVEKCFKKLSQRSIENGDSLEKALKSALFILDSGGFVNYWDAIDYFYDYYVSEDLKTDLNRLIPEKCRWIRRIILTPSRVLLWPADLMSENRLLRSFDSEYFIRVSFRDDDLLPLNVFHYSEEIFRDVIENHVIKGLVIGSRHYELLAWSSSQLREHGVSMYARDTSGRSARDIIKWTEMNPRTDMNIPKCLSRIGQCFSETENVCHIPLNHMHVEFVEDIMRGFNPETNERYCFSDGIGKISPRLVQQIVINTGEDSKSSAFQIRYAGCKGMLVIDPNLTDKDIIFRKSMRKYECYGKEHTNLEIARRSKPLQLRLNRQLITILNDLGVPNEVFLRLQKNMLEVLIEMLLDEREAVEFLKRKNHFREFEFEQLSESGIALTTEPFFRTFLLSVHRHMIENIKRKANIEIHPDYGRNMFGVLDETGKLKYGQVFVQYSRDISFGKSTPDDTEIRTGTVLVTKCPCVHPADVRKFTAVNIPELSHIVDCIVFPQKGHRPHPDEMAGSDLDGDEYSVIWMEDLFFDGKNFKAPNYPKPQVNKFNNVSKFLNYSKRSTKGIAGFLMDYVKRDQIGKIAHAHLAFAEKYSVKHHICKSIAMKHAFAVDFAKTGYSEHLDASETPEQYPEFMEKFWKKRFKSRKALGTMYRVSKDFETRCQTIGLQYSSVKVDDFLVVTGWEEFEHSAIASRDAYNKALKLVLETYGISHEAEAFGGSFLKLHDRFNLRRNKAEIVKVVNIWLMELIKMTKEQFFADFQSSQKVNSIEKYFQKASAWYVVTYREERPEFLSFPWVVSQILANIRIEKHTSIANSLPPRFPYVLKIESQMEMSGMYDHIPDLAIEYLEELSIKCDRNVVERAIMVLTEWAENKENLLNLNENQEHNMLYKSIIVMIAYAAEHPLKSEGRRQTSLLSSEICMAFLKLCVQSRFWVSDDMENQLSLYMPFFEKLEKRATGALHSIAVTGNFLILSDASENWTDNGAIMEPISIDSSIFEHSPVPEFMLKNAASILHQKYQGLMFVFMREDVQRKKVIVVAKGEPSALSELRNILTESEKFLKKLFQTMLPPYSISVFIDSDSDLESF